MNVLRITFAARHNQTQQHNKTRQLPEKTNGIMTENQKEILTAAIRRKMLIIKNGKRERERERERERGEEEEGTD